MNNQKMALLAGLAAAIMAGAVLAQPSIVAAGTYNASSGANTTGTDNSELTTFEEEALKAEEDVVTPDNATLILATQQLTYLKEREKNLKGSKKRYVPAHQYKTRRRTSPRNR